jgi:hypothetical protein
MSPQTLLALRRARPFRPIRITLADGESYDVYHPELIWVGAKEVRIGFSSDPNSTLFERFVVADLSTVARAEPLDQAQPPQGIGQPPG